MRAVIQAAVMGVALSTHAAPSNQGAEAMDERMSQAVEATEVGEASVSAITEHRTPEAVTVSSDAQISARILCLKRARTGSRIVKRRCQSVADWKAEIDGEYIKRYLLEL